MTRRTKYFPFAGGVDEVTAPLALEPGYLIGAKNYEIDSSVHAGYRRIDGYERFDGQSKPSEASYYILNFDAGSAAISDGDTVDGGTSGASGVALADAVVESGSYGGGDAAGYLVLGRVSGTFADDEDLEVSAVKKSEANGTTTENGTTDDTLHDTYRQAAMEDLRDQIAAVPGSGPIRGVWKYDGTVYAFRDNAGGTAGVMHKSTTSGWSTVNLGFELAFDSGSQKASGDDGVEVGDTIEGNTSGATATIVSIAITGGSWSGGDAAGYLYFDSQTGTFQSENLDVGADNNVASISGDSTANALSAGGRYEFINENFYGSASSKMMYGCNGVNKGFEFNGSGFHLIHTGMSPDTPIHVTEHKKHLFFAFANGSVQHSSIGVPLEWSVVTGASEISTGDEVTGFSTLPSDALAIMNRNRTYILYGTSSGGSNPWNLTELSDEAGAIEWTIQRMGKPIYYDDRGLTHLEAVQAYGDFQSATFSQKIKNTLDAKKSLVQSSLRVRDKNQYRLFFSDSSMITVSFDGNKLAGITLGEYDDVVSCCCSVEDSSGAEELFFGSDDGFVYQLDKGTNFDGDAIEAFVRPAFNYMQSAEYRKRFFKAVLEVTAATQCTLEFAPDFDYSENEDIGQSLIASSGGGYWDIDVWGEFEWSQQSVANPEAYIDGNGVNIGGVIYSSHTYEEPHTLHGMTIHYSVRGIKR